MVAVERDCLAETLLGFKPPSPVPYRALDGVAAAGGAGLGRTAVDSAKAYVSHAAAADVCEKPSGSTLSSVSAAEW